MMDALVALFDVLEDYPALPLSEELGAFYGRLAFPLQPDRPYVITNFVSSLDGVVTLDVPGHSGGGDISGFNASDRAVMGLLRAAAGAVIVGASQLHQPPGTIWTPEFICPTYSHSYAQLREALGLTKNPLQVIVSRSGKLDYHLPIFQTVELSILLITSPDGAQVAAKEKLSRSVTVQELHGDLPFTPQQILDAIQNNSDQRLLLIEGGPGLASSFVEARLLDELFLTLSPQIAGRDNNSVNRLGFVSGHLFAPFNPVWGKLCSVKQSDAHLFLRYQFRTG